MVDILPIMCYTIEQIVRYIAFTGGISYGTLFGCRNCRKMEDVGT